MFYLRVPFPYKQYMHPVIQKNLNLTANDHGTVSIFLSMFHHSYKI